MTHPSYSVTHDIQILIAALVSSNSSYIEIGPSMSPVWYNERRQLVV